MKEEKDRNKEQFSFLNYLEEVSLPENERAEKLYNLMEEVFEKAGFKTAVLSGNYPESPKGEYFMGEFPWWPWLWRFCIEVAGDKMGNRRKLGPCDERLSLNETQAMQVAKILEEKLASGAVKQEEEDAKAWNQEMSNLKCIYCEGTGRRKRPPEVGAGDMHCNGCNGEGRQPFDTWVYFSEDNVRKFAEFIKDSGGFTTQFLTPKAQPPEY